MDTFTWVHLWRMFAIEVQSVLFTVALVVIGSGWILYIVPV
jgi:hypothetical protein